MVKITVSVSYRTILNIQVNENVMPQACLYLFVISAHMNISIRTYVIKYMFKIYYTFSVKGNKYKVTSSVVSKMQETAQNAGAKYLPPEFVSKYLPPDYHDGLGIHSHGASISMGNR